jgi:hypothetical protein
LANFLEVECFVYVACGEAAVVGDKVGLWFIVFLYFWAVFPLLYITPPIVSLPCFLFFRYILRLCVSFLFNDNQQLMLVWYIGIFKADCYAL